MSSEIQIILLEDVAGLGHSGDIVTIPESQSAELFAQGSAAQATDSAQKLDQHPDIDGTDLYVTAFEDTLIAEAINQQYNLKLKPEDISISGNQAIVALPKSKRAAVNLVLAETDEEA